jgi:hypothetical protein
MKMDKVAGSKNDEFFTPKYAIEPILKYISPKSTIWCPFDTSESLFVKLFESCEHHVLNSHINEGKDFFEYEPSEKYDYIISNPPYSKKTEVLQRLFELKKPFAMLLGVVGLFESQKRFNMFKNNEFEIMYLNKRVSYFQDYNDIKPKLNPPFSSVYLCSKMLNEKIIFEEVDKNNLV